MARRGGFVARFDRYRIRVCRAHADAPQQRARLAHNGAPGGIRAFASLTERIHACAVAVGPLQVRVMHCPRWRAGRDSTRSLRSLSRIRVCAVDVDPLWAREMPCPLWRAGRDSNPRPSGSKRDPNRGNIKEIPFSSKIRVNPDRFPDPLQIVPPGVRTSQIGSMPRSYPPPRASSRVSSKCAAVQP